MKLYGKIQFYNGGFITSWAFGEINGRKFIYVNDGWIHVFGGTYDMPEWEERQDMQLLLNNAINHAHFVLRGK